MRAPHKAPRVDIDVRVHPHPRAHLARVDGRLALRRVPRHALGGGRKAQPRVAQPKTKRRRHWLARRIGSRASRALWGVLFVVCLFGVGVGSCCHRGRSCLVLRIKRVSRASRESRASRNARGRASWHFLEPTKRFLGFSRLPSFPGFPAFLGVLLVLMDGIFLSFRVASTRKATARFFYLGLAPAEQELGRGSQGSAWTRFCATRASRWRHTRETG